LAAGSTRFRLGGLMATLPDEEPTGSIPETVMICNID
jgi:hypothetical protein